MMKINFKLAALAIPFFFLISCSDSNDVQESKLLGMQQLHHV